MSETTDSKDAVVIAGKGADAFQIVNGKRDNYAGDIEVAKKIFVNNNLVGIVTKHWESFITRWLEVGIVIL